MRLNAQLLTLITLLLWLPLGVWGDSYPARFGTVIPYAGKAKGFDDSLHKYGLSIGSMPPRLEVLTLREVRIGGE